MVSLTSYGDSSGGGGSQSEGSALGGLINVKGSPSGSLIADIIGAVKNKAGGPGFLKLLASMGGAGLSVAASESDFQQRVRASTRIAEINRRNTRAGISPIPYPTLPQAGIYQQVASPSGNAPSGNAPVTKSAGVTLGSVTSGIGDAVAAGLRIAQWLAYLQALFGPLFSSGGGGGGVPRRTIATSGGLGMGYYLAPSVALDSGGDSGSGSFLSGLGGLAGGIGAVISSIRGGSSTSFPGSAMALGNYGSVLGNTALGRAMGLAPSGSSRTVALASQLGATCVIGSVIGVPSPTTGRTVWLRSAGVPAAWTGDRAAAKRWHKCHPRRRSGGR